MYYGFLAEDPLQHLETHPNLLGGQDFAKSVAGLIQAAPESSLVGLWGDWGSGKTRVLHILTNVINDRALVVQFNPWLSAKKATWIARLRANLIEASLAAGIAIDEEALELAIERDTESYSKTRHLNTGKKVTRTLLEFVGVNTEHVDALREQDIDYQELACMVWASTVRFIRANMTQNRSIVVIVDDLDRCEPDYIRTLLDTTFGSLRVDGVTFLIATDRNSVVASLSQLLPSGNRGSANQYLEKLIAIDISIPYPTSAQVAEFVQVHTQEALTMIEDSQSIRSLKEYLIEGQAQLDANRGDKKQIAAGMKAAQNAVDSNGFRILNGVGGNPRRIKRVLVRYLRAFQLWSAEYESKLGSPELRAEHGGLTAFTLELTVGLILLRELSPVFFDRYLLDYNIARLAIAALGGEHDTTAKATPEFRSLKEQLVQKGFFHDPTVNEICRYLYNQMEYFFMNLPVHVFASPVRLARQA